jgi:hypothetical protein
VFDNAEYASILTYGLSVAYVLSSLFSATAA